MTAEKDKLAAPSQKPAQTPVAGETGVFTEATSSDAPHAAAAVSIGDRWLGKSLGKYQVVGVLGEGGMGVVLKAHDPQIDRTVAIKLLADHFATDAIARGRFLGEARAVGKLNHPNVVAIYEIFEEGNLCYLVMEHVPGGSLGDRLEKQGPCSVLDSTRTLVDACKGMSAAHAVNLIHRDLKPANLLRAADSSTKITDFGLAKNTSAASHQLTQLGTVVGTPFFMSPEQCEEKPVDARSDIYALGATYFALLTGRSPYENSDSVPRVMYNHVHGPIPDPRSINPLLPEGCAQIVARAMAKSPADRYQTVEAMMEDLQTVAAALATGIGHPSLPVRGRRVPSLVLTGAAGLLAVVVIALLFWRPWERASIVTPPASGEPIKVGVLHSLSGTMASSESGVVDATLFAIDEINQSGGLLGRPVKGVVADGRSDSATFLREAERLIVKEKVSAVFGCWTSASRKTVKPIFEQHDHLLMYPVQYEGLETSPNIVYLGAAPNQQIIPAVRWAVKSMNKKRFFLVGSDYVFPRSANEIIKDYLKSMDGRVIGEAYIPLGSQKVAPVIQAILNAKPDMILNTINGDSNIAFFRALRAAGIKAAEVPTLSFSVGEEGLRSLNPADIQGDYAAWTYFHTVNTPENKQFVQSFQEKFPQHVVTDPMEAAYVGVKLWAQAVMEAKTFDVKKTRRALLNQRLAAPCGPVRIDPETQHCSKTPRIGQIQNDGQFKIIWTASEPVAPAPYPSTRTSAEWRDFLQDMYTGWGSQWSAPEPGILK